jgi:hypothetical protein
MGIKFSSEDGAPQLNESPPVQLSRESLSQIRIRLVAEIENPQYPLLSPLDVTRNDILVRPSAQMHP